MLHTGYWKEWNCVKELKMYSTALTIMKLWIPSTFEHISSYIKWKGLILGPHKINKIIFLHFADPKFRNYYYFYYADRPTHIYPSEFWDSIGYTESKILKMFPLGFTQFWQEGEHSLA